MGRKDIAGGAGVNGGGQKRQLPPGGLACSLGGTDSCSSSHHSNKWTLRDRQRIDMERHIKLRVGGTKKSYTERCLMFTSLVRNKN